MRKDCKSTEAWSVESSIAVYEDASLIVSSIVFVESSIAVYGDAGLIVSSIVFDIARVTSTLVPAMENT